MMLEPVLMAGDISLEVAAAVGAFGVTAMTGMGGLIAWMIKQEYARTASRSREDALIVENSTLKKEIARAAEKVLELESLVEEVQHERDYERKRANDEIRRNAG